ncbi:MAG TPA: PilC/PilY family type IV pilus protein, partial [Burkholderiales bacterium]|nr:PilC/PilY family type IV pilus protein [Burkholderiales bacterium]
PFFDSFAASGGDGGGTLADVAYYYWNTDLRTPTFNPIGGLGVDVSQNNVPPTSKDPNTAQHMTTFTMGLGLDSTLLWQPGYDTSGTSPDYNAVVSGTSNGNWAVSPNWPVPVANTFTAVDDLWHAAVNGHGTYFSAKSPAVVTSGLLQAFATVAQRTASESSAATSTPNIVPGDNFVFSSTYTTVDWFGDTIEQEIDASTGQLVPGINWSAQAQLDAMVSATSDTRTIYTFDYGPSPAASKLKNFLWGNLLSNEQAYFNGTSGGRNLLAQWSILTSTQQNQCDTGDGTNCGQKLVNYLRGQRAYETPVNSLVTPDSGIDSLFRHRPHILGDIVDAEAVYVRVPIFNYGDPGYAAFKSAQASRLAALYVAANDGMLHALNANTGSEMWAYIPSMVMPNMWNLARFDYSTNHMYFVDATPTSGDICTSNCSTPTATWATILVGGLNGGGRGFYALDITNPASPKALWELRSPANCTLSAGVNVPFVGSVPQDPVNGAPPILSDCDIGLSYGNPIITKRTDGKWVVLVTSGYNNIVPGTGGGFLYVIDAVTGAILNKIATLIPGTSTNAGNTTTPSGLARINSFVNDTQTDNTSLRIYGGDLNGNLWRIDGSPSASNTLAVSGNTATLLAILGTASGGQGSGSQPITTKPELGEITVAGVGTFEIVYVGTGLYLAVTDISNTSQQSFYAIKDPLGPFPGWGAVHGSPNMIQQTLTESIDPQTLETVRSTTANAVDFSSKIGWFIDFNPGSASPGERTNTDPSLDLGILSFVTNAPDTNACNLGGKSYRYFLNYTTGGPLPSSPNGVSGALVAFALATRPVIIEVGGKLEQIINTQGVVKIFPLPPLQPAAGGKRIFWREIIP